MVKNIFIKSPDEWATTKQVCRDESVVYLFLSSTNIYIYCFVYMLLTLVLVVSVFYLMECVLTQCKFIRQV